MLYNGTIVYRCYCHLANVTITVMTTYSRETGQGQDLKCLILILHIHEARIGHKHGEQVSLGRASMEVQFSFFNENIY